MHPFRFLSLSLSLSLDSLSFMFPLLRQIYLFSHFHATLREPEMDYFACAIEKEDFDLLFHYISKCFFDFVAISFYVLSSL